MTLTDKVAIVTGASRGIGKGIALGLALEGATVIVTGRTENADHLPEFLRETTLTNTVREINSRGGRGIAHFCDHGSDRQVEELFERVIRNFGTIDILVNNAWAGGKHILEGHFFNTPFWEQPVELFDDELRVGLRSDYVASRLAAKQMVKQKLGLIVNISYYGARRYFNNVSYGVCKAAIDKLSADTAHELREYGVTVISLYPGSVQTEGMLEFAKYNPDINIDEMESIEFAGKCVAALANDPRLIEKTGKVLITAEIAREYKFTDINGRQPVSQRELLWQD